MAGATSTLPPLPLLAPGADPGPAPVAGRPLSALLAAGVPADAALRLAHELVRAVAALHARGIVHGALQPSCVRVRADGGLALVHAGQASRPEPARPGAAAALAFTAPEVLRGASPSRASDAFSVAAMVYALVGGRAPFGGDAPFEVMRRVLHEEPARLALLRPDLPKALEAAVTGALEKRAWRRSGVGRIVKAFERARPAAVPTPTPTPTPSSSSTSTPTPTPTSTPTPTPTATATATSTSTSTATPTPTPTPTPTSTSTPTAPTRLPALRARLTWPRSALLALPLAAAVLLVFLPESDSALADDVGAMIAGRDLARAAARLDAAATARPGDPLVEKLRGDVACARGAPGECVRRYRVALAARPALREDPAVRANARRLLGRAQSCDSKRAAAELLGELRDPAALPELEAARRAGGLFAFLCAGDSLDRAIRTTRAAARAGDPR